MSVISSVIESLLKPGDHVICSLDCYGGTFAYLKIMLDKLNISFTLIDTTNLSQVINAIKPETKMILFESVTNPTMKITDIESVCAAVKGTKSNAHGLHSNGSTAHDAKLLNPIYIVVDNTFMTPFFLNPLDLGADIVVHSVTKYMNVSAHARLNFN